MLCQRPGAGPIGQTETEELSRSAEELSEIAKRLLESAKQLSRSANRRRNRANRLFDSGNERLKIATELLETLTDFPFGTTTAWTGEINAKRRKTKETEAQRLLKPATRSVRLRAGMACRRRGFSPRSPKMAKLGAR